MKPCMKQHTINIITRYHLKNIILPCIFLSRDPSSDPNLRKNVPQAFKKMGENIRTAQIQISRSNGPYFFCLDWHVSTGTRVPLLLLDLNLVLCTIRYAVS